MKPTQPGGNQNGYDYLFKIILVGDSSVGKTSYLIRLTKNVIKKPTQPTIGAEYASQQIYLEEADKVVKAIIWDTAGAEKYKAITVAHYRQSVGALLFYDLTDKSSFENALTWRQDIFENTDEGIIIMLIGNKLDLIESNPDLRATPLDEVKQFCSENNLLYEETSAKDGINVKNSFESLVSKIYEQKNTIEEEIPRQQMSNGQQISESEETKREKDKVVSKSIQITQPPQQTQQTQSSSCCGQNI